MCILAFMQLSLPHLAPGDAVLSTLGFPFVPFRLGSWKMRTKRDLAAGPGRQNAIGTDHKRDPQGAALVVFALWHWRTGFAPMELVSYVFLPY
ncbi:MAG: hypothetical protein C7B43_17720 [Sulfobacillus benefaciens]|uniref:Uncharacterized protein n=1 Tax=Sulfobacillus benefaciens TaxID=453960 RepID=A0A2T2WRZ5_9FIRM|nr:MAG: hypothetical protein C7B43_17720 [Sulfobacillus benefaciens]